MLTDCVPMCALVKHDYKLTSPAFLSFFFEVVLHLFHDHEHLRAWTSLWRVLQELVGSAESICPCSSTSCFQIQQVCIQRIPQPTVVDAETHVAPWASQA